MQLNPHVYDVFVTFCVNVFLKEFAVEEKEESKPVEKQERIVKDLKQMSKKEKMKLLKKESPELLELIQDFKAKVRPTEIWNNWKHNQFFFDTNSLFLVLCEAQWTEKWAAAPHGAGQEWKDPTRKGEGMKLSS